MTTGPLVRSRLASTSNNGRIELWTIAWNAFRAHPLDGTGADTFETSTTSTATAPPSSSTPTRSTSRRSASWAWSAWRSCCCSCSARWSASRPLRRGRDRALYAALFSAGLAWALHAGVDWDWQMPAVSLWFAALGGLALGRPELARGLAARGLELAAGLRSSARWWSAPCVFPALVLASQVRLNEATNAYAAGNCAQRRSAGAALDRHARNARAAVADRGALRGPRRPLPARAAQICAAASRRTRTTGSSRRRSRRRTAAVGSDARAAGRRSPLRLNPLDPGVDALAQALAAGPRRAARAAARAFLSQQIADRVRMSRDRSDEAFDRLYTEHAAGLLGFLTYQTGDRALAEDIVADTFERVLSDAQRLARAARARRPGSTRSR